jgi:hypothetical protein
MSPIQAIPSPDLICDRLERLRRERSILRRLFRLSVESQQLHCESLHVSQSPTTQQADQGVVTRKGSHCNER